jgi:hypothetical protein
MNGAAVGLFVFAPFRGGDALRVVALALVTGNVWMTVEIVHIFEWRVRNSFHRRAWDHEVPRHLRDLVLIMVLLVGLLFSRVAKRDDAPIEWTLAPPFCVLSLWLMVKLHQLRRFQADQALREIQGRGYGLHAVRSGDEHFVHEHGSSAQARATDGTQAPVAPHLS